MEFENVNRAYDTLVKPKMIYIKAWQEGRTGVPIVDMHAMFSYGIY
jgi:deoxyribodipyrimidine photo-lyase